MGVAIWVLVLLFCFSWAAAKQPHVVFILADDLGWDDVGFHGSPDVLTPNLNALAREGVMLSNYYVQPICTPTRSALLTGRHPIHTGLQRGVIVADQPYGLSLNETVMPEYFKRLGYDTHLVGKWHLGFFAKEYTPTQRGFDSHFGYWNGMSDYFDHTSHEAGMWGLSFYRNMTPMTDQFGQYSTEMFTRRTLDIIDGHNSDKPMFLYLAHQAVHSSNQEAPLEAPWRYQKRNQHIKHKGRRMFASMINALDESVGNVTRALAAKGYLEDTIIVFSTDNGGPAAGFDLNYASNWPLRGIKATLWEGGVRGSSFVWNPRLKNPGSINQDMLHVTDWLPSLYRAAGGDPSDVGNIDGMDVWPVFESGAKSPRSEVLHNYLKDPPHAKRIGGKALRVGDWKIVYGLDETMNGWYKPEAVTQQPEGDSEWRAWSEEQEGGLRALLKQSRDLAGSPAVNTPFNHSVVVNCGPRPTNVTASCEADKAPCLFHIPSDPCEYNNVAVTNQDIVGLMLKRLNEYAATAVHPRNKPGDPRSDPKLHGGAWVPWRDLKDLPRAEW